MFISHGGEMGKARPVVEIGSTHMSICSVTIKIRRSHVGNCKSRRSETSEWKARSIKIQTRDIK